MMVNDKYNDFAMSHKGDQLYCCDLIKGRMVILTIGERDEQIFYYLGFVNCLDNECIYCDIIIPLDDKFVYVNKGDVVFLNVRLNDNKHSVPGIFGFSGDPQGAKWILDKLEFDTKKEFS